MLVVVAFAHSELVVARNQWHDLVSALRSRSSLAVEPVLDSPADTSSSAVGIPQPLEQCLAEYSVEKVAQVSMLELVSALVGSTLVEC